MARKIARLRVIESIKTGPDSEILPDGTITNPVPYAAVDVILSDGDRVQVECVPEELTRQQIIDALRELPNHTYGEVSEGDEI